MLVRERLHVQQPCYTEPRTLSVRHVAFYCYDAEPSTGREECCFYYASTQENAQFLPASKVLLSKISLASRTTFIATSSHHGHLHEVQRSTNRTFSSHLFGYTNRTF